MRVATAQLPAIDDSEDKIFTTPNAVIMLDGASAFVPVPVPVSTYADHLGRAMRNMLYAQPDADLRVVLAEAISETARVLDLSEGESPSSTVTIARTAEDGLDVLVLGDSVLILPEEVLTDDRLARLDFAAGRRYRERLAAGAGYDDEHRAILRQLQNQQAVRRNRAGGYWIAEADPTVAAYAIAAHRHSGVAPWAILATDGAYHTMCHLGITDWPALAHAPSEQLQDLLARCRKWEAEIDPQARQLPRPKRHDDKSIAALLHAPSAQEYDVESDRFGRYADVA